MSTIEEAMAFIHSACWKKSKLGLSRITELMELLDNPQKKLKFIHIAGTNGKGSTAAMLASILQESGYKTGLFTSPFVHKFSERMQINSVCITDSEIEKFAVKLYNHTSRMQDCPTEFELITAMAMLYFYENECDIVVLEVGMGGRLDATNIIDTPEAAVITSIGLDHTGQLGDTEEKIAAQKAGIIKPEGIVISYPQKKSVADVILDKCGEQNARVTFADVNKIRAVRQNLNGQQFEYNGIKNLTIPLLGEHQLRNAAVVITTIDALQERGWHITEDTLRNGLQKTFWPARFEVMRRDPVFIADSAHNPHGVNAVVNTLTSLFPGKKITFLLGVSADKDYPEMIRLLIPCAKRFFTVMPNSSRALPAEDLAAHINKYNVDVIFCESIESGVNRALEVSDNNDVICALGSFFMIGGVRECLLAL